ncbi:GDSL-type esterase/lipase family protein [Chondrinema litorale]|uniref:GDSL-type esterase/lipase family protein n=1 Tax=Chondrinema litorale TaxID=2994555 RepID=UPI0025436229|nr:GDSL-type esterase/lipase family protein [Chondrinema litorale]UZR97301.1 GDSL-type esterase/lipase family protein [Chondrinema litorale]
MNKALIRSILPSIFFCIILISCGSFKKEDQPITPQFWEKAIAKYEEADRQNPPKQGEILFIGSSSFTLWKNVAGYFPSKEIINRGFGGAQTRDVLFYKERLILPYQPSQVVIYIGENDLSVGKTASETAYSVEKLINCILQQFPNTSIVYISIKPSPSKWDLKDKMQDTNKLISAFIAQNKKVEFVDVWDSMLDEDGKPPMSIFLEDSLHMNDKGYAIWQKKIAPHLK